MDYALIVATALGAIALYLLLPRGRSNLVKLGGLAGVLALGVAITYLIHLSAGAHGGRTAVVADVFFYAFAVLALASATGVVCHPRPLYAALYFVLMTLAVSGLFIMLMAEFIAVVLIIIYAGAILVTYVFVIMLASQGGEAATAQYDTNSADGFMAILVSFVLLGTVLQVMFYAGPNGFMHPLAAGQTAVHGMGSLELLGANLYSRYALPLELAGILLTISLVGAVMIARKNEPTAHILGTGDLPAE